MDSIPSPKSNNELEHLFRIFSQYYNFLEEDRYHFLSEFCGDIINEAYFNLLILALNDPYRKIRMLAANRIIEKGIMHLDKIINLLGDYSLYRRNYAGYILGRWFPAWKRVKYYEILRDLPIEKRTFVIDCFMDRVLTDSDSNRLFDAINSLELIGDFRALSLLKHTGRILNSQIRKHLGKHDDFSVFLLVLYFLQHPVDNSLKQLLLSEYLIDLFRICQIYSYAPGFEQIFNELNLIGNLVIEVLPLGLSEKLVRILQMRRGSWAYSTMVWVLTAYYPSSIQMLEEMKQEEKNHIIQSEMGNLIEELLANFKVRLNSGLNLFL